jgi:hypothetical protein
MLGADRAELLRLRANTSDVLAGGRNLPLLTTGELKPSARALLALPFGNAHGVHLHAAIAALERMELRRRATCPATACEVDDTAFLDGRHGPPRRWLCRCRCTLSLR